MTSEDERYEQRRRQRAEARRKKKLRERRIKALIIIIIVAIVIILGFVVLKKNGVNLKKDNSKETTSVENEIIEDQLSVVPEATEPQEPVMLEKTYQFDSTSSTVDMSSSEVVSTYGLMVDVDNETIVASRGGTDRINPASMTKILTVLVAAEQLEDTPEKLEEQITISPEIANFVYVNDCSAVCYSLEEPVPVKDLFYGTILPSGADAAMALAEYVAGSQEAFVELMNQKLADLGISDTAHFTNCIGIYDENHYCTLYDMAVILNAAMDNELCREALSEHVFVTTPTEEHPEGLTLSNWFLRRIEDKDCGGTVVGAKTGFVKESGNCAASYFTSNDGRNFICVTAGGTSGWRAIYDHVAAYNIYAVGNTGYTKAGAANTAETSESTDAE